MIEVLGALTLSDRIDAAIRARFNDHRFPAVTFLGTGARVTRRTGPETEPVTTLLIRPITAGFVDANSFLCGGRQQDIELWTWIALAHFDSQVSLDSFEHALRDQPIIILRDDTLFRQIDISLLDVEWQHPVEKQPSQGTRVTYRFQADLSPI